MPLPLEIYQQRIDSLTADRSKALSRQQLLGWSRFALAIIFGVSIYALHNQPFSTLLPLLILLVAIFLRLVILASRNNEKIRNLDRLISINREEIDILNGVYVNRKDGADFVPHEHAYAEDLDIFGRASLYQYLNRTSSEQGSRLLAGWLLEPTDTHTVRNRQQAATELSKDYVWRQQFLAHGIANPILKTSEQRINDWLKEPAPLTSPSLQWLRYLLPAIVFGFLIAYLLDIIPGPIFSGIAFIFFIIAGLFSWKITALHQQLNKVSKEMQTLSQSLSDIELLKPTSPLLAALQKNLTDSNGNASAAISQLTTILERLDVRLNPFIHIFLNTFLFWDLQQALQLARWQKVHAGSIPAWFQTLAETEALSTLAAAYFNHPNWQTPILKETPGLFDGEGIGHPLIPAGKRVNSSFATTGRGRIGLITGSNMAGKSTFLRSIGVNIVLAMMGAPVCAQRLSLAPMRVMSSMRIKDNLEESTSTFYAELKKLKQIIEAANRHEDLFILLDEILRGTNSLDRHTGSEALIRQLIREAAVGILATHDLQLAALAGEYPGNLENYHFDVQIHGEELFFDYKLKHGVCKSMNASILMRKIGIEM
jgi:hypothetical protein